VTGIVQMMLATRAFRSGRAQRSALFRHRHLVETPLVLAFWQLGAEPFSAAACAWGVKRHGMSLRVAGDPRNRDLAFACLLELARWFNPLFERSARRREKLTSRTGREWGRAVTAPQVIVPTTTTIDLIGRLGRRLAYLPSDGPRPVDPALARLGAHFQFLAGHARMPGQQLVVAMDALLRDHWETPQSSVERGSLAALDAWIAPPAGTHGFSAAAAAERRPVGPTPGTDDERLEPLVAAFHRARGGSTDPGTIAPLLPPLERHYGALLGNTWNLVWRALDRERAVPEARSVARRWAVDREDYTRHMDGLELGIRRRARQTARQAAEHLRRLETAAQLLAAEEACDDPLRMLPYLLAQKAVQGKIVAIDREHRELATKRSVVRPLVTLEIDEPCTIPVGKELWWTERTLGAPFEVRRVDKRRLILLAPTANVAHIPPVSAHACFSVLDTNQFYPRPLPNEAPWTHVAPGDGSPVDIEEST
jgi:hypothetical protein